MMRLSYDMWPQYNRRLRGAIAALTEEKLAIRPSADGFRRDPTWAGRTISTIRAIEVTAPTWAIERRYAWRHEMHRANRDPR
ncbi:MAG: hypothetical protein H0X68_05840 [Chloroflexi bacterium]|nr:hypothetical protein [Chloroflexota bacterium]